MKKELTPYERRQIYYKAIEKLKKREKKEKKEKIKEFKENKAVKVATDYSKKLNKRLSYKKSKGSRPTVRLRSTVEPEEKRSLFFKY